MAILPVVKVGNPILRQVAADLAAEELRAPATQQLIDDMIDTMRSRDGVGIASPQVGVSKRIVVVEYAQNPRYPGHAAIPLTVLANARILERGEEEQAGWEG